jgi:3'-phosphoadenosine 5'-phosphosulfate sulfotransferase (PAPS reductase)/FAD synthetase
MRYPGDGRGLTLDQIAAYEAGDPADCAWIEMDLPSGWQSKHKTQDQRDVLSVRGEMRNAGLKLSFEKKLALSEKIIDSAFNRLPHCWALSYSGGKDSTVLSHLMVERLKLAIPHITSDTRLEYPETKAQIKHWKQWLRERGVSLHVAYPALRPREVWQKVGVPLWSKVIGQKVDKYVATGNRAHLLRVPQELHAAAELLRQAGIGLAGSRCCDELKKKPMHRLNKKLGILGHFTGVRVQESRSREMMWLQRGALYYSTAHREWLCHPLSFWTKDEIAGYLKQHNIYPILPKGGASGCVCCMFGSHVRPGPTPLQSLYHDNPKMWHAAIFDWGYKDALDIAGIPYVPDGVGYHTVEGRDEISSR